MGREIRRVPLDWQHPKNDSGNYEPLFDKDYETAREEWLQGWQQWQNGTHPDLEKHPEYKEKWDYWEWESPPQRDWYRPKFESDPIAYQIYETVSEGTPVSPVFETKDEMKHWLIRQGHSEYSADQFIKDGWVMSGLLADGRFASNLDAYDLEKELNEQE